MDRGTLGHEKPVGTEDGNKEESWRWAGDPCGQALSWKGVDGIPGSRGQRWSQLEGGKSQEMLQALWGMFSGSGGIVEAAYLIWGTLGGFSEASIRAS